MNKTFVALSICLLSCCFLNNLYAQKPLANKVALSTLEQQFDKVYQQRKLQLTELSRKHSWALYRRQKDGGVVSLHSVNSIGFPVFVKTDNNTTSAATTRTNTLQPGGSLNLNLNGSSTYLNNKLAIWDAGSVLSTHQEFAGKTIMLKDAKASVEDHSTHVAGTMIAKGVYAPAKGMSFGATSLLSYDYDNDITEMSAAAPSLLLSNHSYGTIAGWYYNDTESRWEWYGLPGDNVDYNFGFYDEQAQGWDKIAYNAPYYLIVESAGNNRNDTGPAVGEDYWGFKSRTDATLVDKGPRPANISSNDSYDIIPDYANAKNILTIGAVNPLPYGPAQRGDVSIAYFSSWGPTDDGRIKPDICGMGVNVLSTSSSGTSSYVTMSGTSMAAPNVTGSLYLLQEYYAKLHAGSFMRSATLKGLACHTAFDAGNAGPDYVYGWGLLDMQKAAQAITDNGTKSMINENTLIQGTSQTYKVTTSGSGPLVASISWTDPQGTLVADGTINDRTPKLVDDLDIRVSDGTNNFLPWILNPDQPGNAATTGDNIRDNIEQIYIAGAVPGRTYTITVSHKKTLYMGSQDYTLIVTGIGGSAYCASAPVSSADSRINNFTFANINNTPVAGCTSYSDYTTQTALLEPGRTYHLSLTLGTCNANFNKIGKVFADWNGDGDFDDAGELLTTTGTILATGTYAADVTVPGNVTIGNYTTLRVVTVETSDPAAVIACGTYPKGETQDYRIQFVQPAVDAGVTAVTGNTPSGVCAGSTNLTVSLRNYGTTTLTSIPVTVTVTAPDQTITTLNETFTGSLAPNSQTDFTLNSTFNTVAGATYSISATTNLATDLVVSDNQASSTLVVAPAPVANNLSAFYCTNTKAYQLSGSVDGTLLWYQNATDTSPLAVGNLTSTTTAPANNTFYAGINDFAGTVGPANKNVFTGGGYNQFSPSIQVKTLIPAVIESARLYIGNAAQITFTVTDSTGKVVSTSTINAVATRTTPAEGASADDPADQGKVYNLDLIFPYAGTFDVNISYDNTATIYRNNSGVTGYPFTANGVFSITGNTATPGSASYYYYLYDVHVHSFGCSSGARQAVTLSKPVITQNGNTLSSNYSSGNQWYYNGSPINGATGQEFSPAESGNYQVSVAVSGSCTAISDSYNFALVALHPDNSTDIGLTLFPVPAKETLNVLFVAKAVSDVNVALINAAGQVVYTQKRATDAGNFSTTLNVSNLASGTYVLRLTVGDKVYGKKVIIAR